MIEKIDYVSIRERLSLPLLRSLGRDDGVAVCDPVFLLDRSFWSEFAGRVTKSIPYLVVYDFDKSESLKSLVETIAVKFHLKVFNIGPYRLSYADKNFTLSGPKEFIRLIRDAQFVISNSFHATAFAIIFKVPFYVIKRKEAINERMESLLTDCGLSDRIVDIKNNISISSINYYETEQPLNKVIITSCSFIHKVIQNTSI